MSRFSRQSSTDTESKTGKISPTKPVADMVKLHKKFATETDVKTNGDAKVYIHAQPTSALYGGTM